MITYTTGQIDSNRYPAAFLNASGGKVSASVSHPVGCRRGAHGVTRHDGIATGFGGAGPSDLRMAIMIAMRRIPEKFGRRSSDRPTIFDSVNTDYFIVYNVCPVSYGGR
jgi:hypothetical protein